MHAPVLAAQQASASSDRRQASQAERPGGTGTAVEETAQRAGNGDCIMARPIYYTNPPDGRLAQNPSAPPNPSGGEAARERTHACSILPRFVVFSGTSCHRPIRRVQAEACRSTRRHRRRDGVRVTPPSREVARRLFHDRAHTRTQFVHVLVIIGPLVNGRNNPISAISFCGDSSGQTGRGSETPFLREDICIVLRFSRTGIHLTLLAPPIRFRLSFGLKHFSDGGLPNG